MGFFRSYRALRLTDAVNYHRVLNVSRDASKKEVKKAYRQLAKELHPDLNKSPDAPARFKAVQEAYDVLMDDARRAAAELDVGGGVARSGAGWQRRSAEQAAADAARRQQARDLHRTLSWFELLIHPRILFGALPIIIGLGYLLSPRKNRETEKETIYAWKNPNTKRWETPAPWDTTYRTLKPELKKIDRSLVFDSSQGRI